MAKREVTVVINGEEYVSTAAKEAEAGLTLFGKRIPLVLDASKLLEMGLNALKGAFGAVKQFIGDSLAAYDAYTASQRKLEGTAKLSGIALKDLKAVADQGKDSFRLSTVVANDFAAEIGKLTSKAGDIGKSKDAMAAFLDIGAARGLSASDTLKAVQQAILGIDEGTDKLFGKNPSVLYQEYADKIGIAAGKLTDQQKAMALLDSTLVGGEQVRGAYLEYLNSAAGQQEMLSTRMDQTKVSVGAALQPIRTLVLQGLNKLLDVLGPTVTWLAEAANTAGVTLVVGFNKAREVTGTVVAALGRLTGNKDLEAWGKSTAKSAEDAIVAVQATVRKAADGTKQATDDVQAAHQKSTKVTEDELKKQEKEWTDYVKSVKTTIKLVEDAIVSTENVLKRLGPEFQKAYNRQHIDAANAATKDVRDATDDFIKKTFEGKDAGVSAYEEIRSKARLAGYSVADAARSAIDLARAFGDLDASTAATLNSVINLGVAVAKIAGGDMKAIPQALAAAASIISTMIAGDAERKRLVRENTEALDRLSRDVGKLKLNITGEDFQKAQTALYSVMGSLAGGRGAANENDVRKALFDQGLMMTDLERIAKEFGITLRNTSGALNVEAVQTLLNALNGSNIGRLGSSFADQLDFFRRSQGMDNATGAGAVGGLLDFLRNVGGVSALAGIDTKDLGKTREALRNLFVQLNNGQGVQGLGKLTGSQFMDLLLQIIQDIDALGAATGTGTSSGDAMAGSGATVSGGGTTAPAQTIQDVIQAMDTNVATILKDHSTLHQRIASATEGSWRSLQSIDRKMDDLIATTAGTALRLDQQLAAARATANLSAGVGPSFS